MYLAHTITTETFEPHYILATEEIVHIRYERESYRQYLYLTEIF